MKNYTVAINGGYHVSCGISPKIKIEFVFAYSKIIALKTGVALFLHDNESVLDKAYIQSVAEKVDNFQICNRAFNIESYNVLRFIQMLSEFGMNISITETLYKEGYDNNGTNIN